MSKAGSNITLGLAVSYWLLIVVSMLVISAIVFFGTIGWLRLGIDENIRDKAARLEGLAVGGGRDALRAEINRLLHDNIESDTEDYLLVSPAGQFLAGNLSPFAEGELSFDRLTDQHVTRYGYPSYSRLLPHRLANGDVLIVGREMQRQFDLQQLTLNALGVGAVAALVLAATGALILRRRLEHGLARIRIAAHRIEAGDLSARLPVVGGEDEFVRLSRDVNSRLDRIQLLLDGVRNVSNAIAHDLRTPLGRIRVRLDEALRANAPREHLREVARAAIADIDALIEMFDRLLRIAESEAGVGRMAFAPVDLATVATGIAELYDVEAEERGMVLLVHAVPETRVLGDHNLLANAAANLVENALKYGAAGGTIRIGVERQRDEASLYVEDNGPGIPEAERDRVLERFYRLDGSRNVPGNGLGLPIVVAIAQLHWGRFVLEDAAPGLRARLVLPLHQPAELVPEPAPPVPAGAAAEL